MEMEDIIINVVGTIIGGLLLTLLLFLLNEFIFNKKNLTGEWDSNLEITKSGYNLYKGLIIKFKIHLIQKGYEISGSGEKIKEIYPEGKENIYQRDKRVIISVEGYYERKFFAKSIIYLNICEEGTQRQTRATYKLYLKNKNNLEGEFITTAADAKGKIKFTREN